MKLYVGNLPWSIDEAGLKKLFESYGASEANLIVNKFNNRSRGFGFVEIPSDDDAKKAMSEMHKKEIEGRALVVNEAKPMVARDDSRSKPQESGEAPMADPEAVEASTEESMESEGTADVEETAKEAEAPAEEAEEAPKEKTE